MGSVQNELNDLYFKYWDNISSLIGDNNGLSRPLLISIPEAYFSQKARLLIVGQQTNNWYRRGSIDDLLERYKGFKNGEEYRSTPFWNVTRKLAERLGTDPSAITWSNLNKCDFNGKRPSEELEQEIYNKFPVLNGEIELLKPNIILFFSGPYYDSHLKRIFPECKFIKVSDFSERKLCQVEHQGLPSNSYRTYHPRYLRTSKHEQKVLDILEAMINKSLHLSTIPLGC